MIDLPTGEAIAARFFHPPGESRGAALIAPAMAVPQRYYEDFAYYLAANGLTVATFDLRGIGRSRPAKLSNLGVNVVDWAQMDCRAMVDALAARTEGQPFFWIAHSLGGQIVSLVPNRDRITKMITIASGSGYWRIGAPKFKRLALLLWYVIEPASQALFGYFPGKRLNIVGDLPPRVMRQWRSWCLHPEYAVGVEDGARELFATVEFPIVSLSFADDEYMSRQSIESLHGFYTGTTPKLVRLPGSHGIGHFGFFKEDVGGHLWERYVLEECREGDG